MRNAEYLIWKRKKNKSQIIFNSEFYILNSSFNYMQGEFGPSPEEMGITPQITQNNPNNMSEKQIQRERAKKTILERGYITPTKWEGLTDKQKNRFLETELNRDATEYSSEILEVVQNMEKAPATFADLNKTIKSTREELKIRNTELGGMLERRLNDTDKTTGIPKRDSQNDNLRSEIFDRVKGKNQEATAKTLGIVSFDLRSLKLLNDAVSDHKVGDEYLRRVAEKIKKVCENLQELLGIDFTISRDGGDEFGAVFSSKDINLEEEATPEIKNLLTNGIKLETGKTTRVIDIISVYLEQEIGRETHNDLFLDAANRTEYERLKTEGKTNEAETLAREQMRKKFEGFVNKGIDDPELKFKMPENFDMHSYVAAGGSTLYETLNRPDPDDYKTYETPLSELHALNILVGAMRAKSDKESYRQKEKQNKEISTIKTEENEFRMCLLSRNEFTRSIIIERKKLELELNKCLKSNK